MKIIYDIIFKFTLIALISLFVNIIFLLKLNKLFIILYLKYPYGNTILKFLIFEDLYKSPI